MNKFDQLHFKDRDSFRSWLVNNHNYSKGIWIIFFKKHTNIKGVSYREALEEALCFGWIDSIINIIDNDKYRRKFTPRVDISNWSNANKKIVKQLINKGKMTEHGLNKIDLYIKTGMVNWIIKAPLKKSKEKLILPDYILKIFAENEPALTNFNNLAQTYKKHYIQWITFAKRQKTTDRRINESIKLLKANEKLGLK